MPLVYQGRLLTRRPRGPAAAFAAGEKALAESTHDRRIDLRLAWDAPEPFARCAEVLPADFAGYWIDVAAEVDPARLGEIAGWAERLRGGRLGLACVVAGREGEVSLRLPGPEPLRLDAERLDPQRRHLYAPRMTVTYTEGGERTGLSVERRALAAARVRAAVEALGLDPPPDRAALFVDDPRIPPADPRWLAVDPAPLRAPFPAEAGPGEVVGLKGAVVDGTPFGLLCEADDPAARARLWRRWAGLLDRLDLVLVRCMGRRAEIEALLERLDLHHRHPDQPHQTFGVCTVHHPDPLPPEAIADILRAPQVTEPLVAWGLRWSDLRLRLDGPLDQAAGPAQSFFVVRTERRRVYDSLHLTLHTEDPRAPSLRAARQALAARFGGRIEQPSAWQYVGPPLDSPRGRRYAALREALAALPARVVAESAPVGGETPARPGRLGRLVERLTDGDDAFDLVAAFERALGDALPGFRHDRRAHLTDRYFVELVRRTPGGVHLVLLRRLHAPPGFRVSLGASLMPVQLADLDPGPDRSAPGLALPLSALVPERADLDWRYAGRASAERAVADAVALLAARGAPFFAAAEAALAAARVDEDAPAPADPADAEEDP